MDLSSLELKFLLRLLEHAPDYRTPISQIKLNAKTAATERNRICQNLCSKGLAEYVDIIQQYRTEPAGKTLLEADTSTIPVSPEELALLQVAEDKIAKPGQTTKVPTGDRQRLLSQLKERGLISVKKSQIKDVWLTTQGRQYLLHDCMPTGAALLPLSMLGTYLSFLRQSFGMIASGEYGSPTQGIASESDRSVSSKDMTQTHMAPETVLNTIRQLDRQFNTDNFLPIFHLRNKLQPPLSRENLDQLLYDLQSQDLIEFSTLQDVSYYSEAEAAAGIPQNIGGALFYISLSEGTL